MKSQNPTTQPDLFGEMLIETIPHQSFYTRVAELRELGWHISSMEVAQGGWKVTGWRKERNYET